MMVFFRGFSRFFFFFSRRKNAGDVQYGVNSKIILIYYKHLSNQNHLTLQLPETIFELLTSHTRRIMVRLPQRSFHNFMENTRIKCLVEPGFREISSRELKRSVKSRRVYKLVFYICSFLGKDCQSFSSAKSNLMHIT